jgi:osmoprotectant transport system permease protein
MKRRAAVAAIVCAIAAASTAQSADTVVVGSKNFEESRLLAEMFAQLIEQHTDLTVERRFNLAGTHVCFEALRTGAIDLYPEYTGTGLASILDESPEAKPTQVLNRVRAEFLARWDLWWLSPLGFENSYALAVPRELAERHGLRTLSQLAAVSQDLTAGLGYEFIERPDGLPGLRQRYGLEFRHVRSLQQALKYQAVASRRIDVLDVYTTDGRLLVHDLQVLEDDLDFFPPYEAAALVRGESLRRHPEVGAALGLLAGAFDEAGMRDLNLRLQEGGETAEGVAQDALERLGLVGEQRETASTSRRPGLAAFMWDSRDNIARWTAQHLALSGAALALGVLVAVPLGLVLERHRRLAEPVIRIVGITQTIPSIALLAFMIPLLGIGTQPALAALWIYSIFPILRNTYSGVRDSDPEAVAAATALGMTDWEVLRLVRLPLATPVILAGVRTSGVLIVGTATLAAFIGAGGLGVPIVAGLQMADATRILAGALPAAALAVAADALLGAVERLVRPRGLG